MGINGYFNLLPDNTPNYSNPDSTITRSEFMAMVYRAETPVQDIESDDTFTTAVGESEYNVYAQSIAEDSYLDITSKSLNNLTYNGTITRAEAVYMLMQHYFADELATVETKGIKFEDAKDSGSATARATGDYSKSDALNSALQNPDKGMPTELYKALALAKEIGLVGTETRWDEGLTKSEAIELTLIALENEKGIASFSFAQGKTSDTIEETEPVVAIEDVTITEEELAAKFDESVFASDVTEAQKERLRKISKEMDLSYLDLADIDEDGKITGTEAQDFLDAYDLVMAEYTDDDETTPSGGSGTTGGGSGSSSDYSSNYIDDGVHGIPDSGELPVVDWGSGDYSGLSDTGHPY